MENNPYEWPPIENMLHYYDDDTLESMIDGTIKSGNTELLHHALAEKALRTLGVTRNEDNID